MLCKVMIKGAYDAEEVSSDGELTFVDNGFDLNYHITGDKCILSVRGATVTQSRRGNFNTDITFVKGKNTVCMLLSGELTGSVPVKTTALDINCGENGVSVTMEYFLGGSKIYLSLKAVAADNNRF